jgi:hypothetical protein
MLMSKVDADDSVDGAGSPPQPGRRISRLAFGDGAEVAAVLYGTVVVMAALTDAYATERHPAKLALVVLSSALVIWVAHLHAHAIGGSLAAKRRLTRADLAHIARQELGILLAAGPPVAALLLGALGFIDETVAVWLALALGILTLAAEGVRYARLERLGPLAALLPVAINVGLGLAIVALKVAFDH